MEDRWGAAFVRIAWQASFGLGGSFAPDWVAGITGIRTQFKTQHPDVKVHGITAEALYGTASFVDGASAICGGVQVISQRASSL